MADGRRQGWGRALPLSLSLLCAAACGSGTPSEGGPARPGTAQPPGPAALATAPPSLLLVTLDTWRWDSIGLSGSGRVQTPNLDRLGREGVYEPEAETPYPLTTPAHASLLTGLFPLNHGILDCLNYSLPPSVPTLAEAFRAQGFTTAAFVSSLSLDRRFGLDRGFGTYDEGRMDVASGANSRDGAEVTAAASAFVAAQPAGARLFLWAHYYDMHMPYRPRPQYDARYPRDPYAAQVAYVDEQVGQLVGVLGRDPGRAWRVVVVGDHGEGLGDHSERGHGLALYRSTLHVPLLLYPRPDRPLRAPRPWRLEDLSGTLRSWFALAPAARSDGTDLFAEGRPDRPLPSLTLQPSFQFGVNPCLGLRRGSWMYMRHGVEELFDLASDPGEERDLAAQPAKRDDLVALREACDRALPRAALEAAAAPTAKAAPADLQALRGLGYLGGLAFDAARLQRANIRDVCEAEGAVVDAQESHRITGAAQPLREAYETLLRRFPRAAPYYRELGELLLREKNIEGAFDAFDHAVRLNPSDVESLVNLAGLHLALGHPDKARVLYESALVLQEADPVAHKNLGTLYAQYLKDPEKAVAHYRRYLELGGDEDQQVVRDYIRSVEARR